MTGMIRDEIKVARQRRDAGVHKTYVEELIMKPAKIVL